MFERRLNFQGADHGGERLDVHAESQMLKRIKLARIRQPGKAAAASKLDAPITAQAAEMPAQEAEPQPIQKEAM